jgi:hypothetical protein
VAPPVPARGLLPFLNVPVQLAFLDDFVEWMNTFGGH